MNPQPQSAIVQALLDTEKVQPLYVYLKQCFERVKKYRFNLITHENGSNTDALRFQTTSFVDNKQVTIGYGRSKKDSKINCSILTIDMLIDRYQEVADYFHSLPNVKTQKSTPIQDCFQTKKVKTNEYQYSSRQEVVGHSNIPASQKILHQQFINFEMFEDVVNTTQSDLSKRASQVAKSLMINDQDLNYYHTFLQSFHKLLTQQQVFSSLTEVPVGSFTLSAMRHNCLGLDIVLPMQKDEIEIFIKFMGTCLNELELRCVEQISGNRLILVSQRVVIRPQSTMPKPLTIHLILAPMSPPNTYPHQINHGMYMSRFIDSISTNIYVQQALILIRQWRDSSGLRLMLPIDILDFLLAQITNKFTLMTQPFIMLRQVIYLIQEDVLNQITNISFTSPQVTLNPFVSQVPRLHYELIYNMGQLRDAAKLIAAEWTIERLQTWIEGF